MSEWDTVLIYKDQADEWRWHREASNGQIIADSGEGYKNFGDAEAMAARVNANAQFVVVDRETGDVDELTE